VYAGRVYLKHSCSGLGDFKILHVNGGSVRVDGATWFEGEIIPFERTAVNHALNAGVRIGLRDGQGQQGSLHFLKSAGVVATV
jgi:hypothetical protein